MKNYIKLLITLIFITCTATAQNKNLEKFRTDLTSANRIARGSMKLDMSYNGDLTKLTYKSYLLFLEKNETPSTKGVTQIIKDANQYLFRTSKNSFLIALYSKNLNAVLFDDANTAFVDSVLVLRKGQAVPDLKDFIKNTDFKF